MNQIYSQSKRGYQKRFFRNVVLKVEQYLPEESRPNSYDGVVLGKVVGGTMNGKMVEAAISKTESNKRCTIISQFINEKDYSYTPVGGYLALRSVNFVNGNAFAKWANKFANPNAQIHAGVPTKITPIYDPNTGTTRKYSSNNETMYKATVLNVNKTVSPKQSQDLYESIKEIFESKQNVYLAMHPEEGKRKNLFFGRSWRDGKLVSVEEATLHCLHEPNLSQIEQCMRSGGKIDVIPIETFQISSKLAASMNQGTVNAINQQEYFIDGYGARFESAIKKLKRVNSKPLEKELFNTLNDKEKNTFAEFGWRGIPNLAFINFFEGLNLNPIPLSKYGYANSTLQTSYLQTENGQELGFVWKARSVGPAVPFDYVSTPNNPQSIKQYFDTFKDLVKDAVVQIEHQNQPTIGAQKSFQHSELVVENSNHNEYDYSL